MIRTRLLLVGSAVTAILSANSLALAADVYFDSVGGDDAKDGTTEATAKKTIKVSAGNTVHIKRGSSYSGSLNLNNATVVTYGCGPRVAISGSLSVTNSTVEGLHAMPTSGSAITVQSGNTVRDCEADGSACTNSAMGISIMGENNKIIGNYVHDFSVSQSGATVNNSGGAEGIMVMGSNNEIAFNSVVNCQSVNTTLGGFEGGCYEIVNGKGAGQTLHDVAFHHNYCEKSVGLFEACSGNYSATAGGVIENHGIIENVTVSYNVSVDSMWLFLLQSVNTDFKNVVFANNTIIHTPKSAEYWDSGGGHFQMALAYDSDTSTGTTVKADNQYYKQGSGFQPGTVAVRNNIFIDNISSSRNAMFQANLSDHSNNLFVPANATVSFAFGGTSTSAFALDATESKVDLSALALSADYQLTAASAPAIDKGATVSMSTSAAMAATPPSTAVFASVFNQDIAKQSVPCGSAPDIGASEYCNGVTLVWPGPSDANSCPGSGGTPSTGGAPSSSGGNANTNTGGKAASGGALPVGNGGASNVTAGGKAATGGAATTKTDGSGQVTPTTGGQPSGTNGSQVANVGGDAGQVTSASGATASVNAGGQVATPTSADTNATGSGGANAGTAASATNGRDVVSAPEDGCACRVAGDRNRDVSKLALHAIGLAALGLARRRRTIERCK